MKYAKILGLILLVMSCQGPIDQTQNEQVDDLVVYLDSLKKAGIEDARTNLFEVNQSDGSEGESTKVSVKVTSEDIFKALKENVQRFPEVVIELRKLPDSVVGDKIYGLCTVSVGNVRKEPRHSSELSSQVLLGHPLRILDSAGDWLQIQSSDGYLGWMDKGAVVPMDKAQVSQWNAEPKVIINKFYVQGKNPERPEEVVSDLVYGNILRVRAENNTANTLLVEYPDQRTAIVSKTDTKSFTEWQGAFSNKMAHLQKDVKEYLGIPYTWGGTSVKGFDCSGFTKSIFFDYGILLQRDASQQANQGNLVDDVGQIENIKAGDLLFFGKKGTKPKVVHVGIALDDGRFVHASGDGYIKINSLDPKDSVFNEKERDRYLFARRYIEEGIPTDPIPDKAIYESIFYED